MTTVDTSVSTKIYSVRDIKVLKSAYYHDESTPNLYSPIILHITGQMSWICTMKTRTTLLIWYLPSKTFYLHISVFWITLTRWFFLWDVSVRRRTSRKNNGSSKQSITRKLCLQLPRKRSFAFSSTEAMLPLQNLRSVFNHLFTNSGIRSMWQDA